MKDIVRSFQNEDYGLATDYAIKAIKYAFKDIFISEENISFKLNKSLLDIDYIMKHLNEKTENYFSFATFEKGDYFCNLSICNGKMGLTYYKYNDIKHNEYDLLIFEEFTPDLTTGDSLMLSMKKQLENFISISNDYSFENMYIGY